MSKVCLFLWVLFLFWLFFGAQMQQKHTQKVRRIKWGVILAWNSWWLARLQQNTAAKVAASSTNKSTWHKCKETPETILHRHTVAFSCCLNFLSNTCFLLATCSAHPGQKCRHVLCILSQAPEEQLLCLLTSQVAPPAVSSAGKARKSPGLEPVAV